MNYSPADLERIAFTKALFSGYSQSQVHDVITRVIEDYIGYVCEINELRNQIQLLEGKIQHYRTIEESMQHTLLIAQHTSESMKSNACEKAANIIKEAEIKAQKMINDANHEVLKIKQNYEDIKKSLLAYKNKSELLLRAQLELLASSMDEN